MDPRGLFLNASLRVKVSQGQADLINSFSGPEFKATDSTLQRELFLWPRENLYLKPQMFPWHWAATLEIYVGWGRASEHYGKTSTNPGFLLGRTHIKLQESLNVTVSFQAMVAKEGGQRVSAISGKCVCECVCVTHLFSLLRRQKKSVSGQSPTADKVSPE